MVIHADAKDYSAADLATQFALEMKFEQMMRSLCKDQKHIRRPTMSRPPLTAITSKPF